MRRGKEIIAFKMGRGGRSYGQEFKEWFNKLATSFLINFYLKLFSVLTLAELLSRIGNANTILRSLPDFPIEW